MSVLESGHGLPSVCNDSVGWPKGKFDANDRFTADILVFSRNWKLILGPLTKPTRRRSPARATSERHRAPLPGRDRKFFAVDRTRGGPPKVKVDAASVTREEAGRLSYFWDGWKELLRAKTAPVRGYAGGGLGLDCKSFNWTQGNSTNAASGGSMMSHVVYLVMMIALGTGMPRQALGVPRQMATEASMEQCMADVTQHASAETGDHRNYWYCQPAVANRTLGPR